MCYITIVPGAGVVFVVGIGGGLVVGGEEGEGVGVDVFEAEGLVGVGELAEAAMVGGYGVPGHAGWGPPGSSGRGRMAWGRSGGEADFIRPIGWPSDMDIVII